MRQGLIGAILKDSVVLVTGGTGSFGRRFLKFALEKGGVRRIVVFSRDELKQFEMQQDFSDERMRYFIGDVRDRDRLHRALRDVDVVVRKHQLRATDFRSGLRLGHDDHFVVWSKPQRPEWMSAEAYAALPDDVKVRLEGLVAEHSLVYSRGTVTPHVLTSEMKAELPGVKKEDVHVSIDGNRVSISAEVKREKEEKSGEKVIRSERLQNSFIVDLTVTTDAAEPFAVVVYVDGGASPTVCVTA